MEYHISRIEKALEEGNYIKALSQGNKLLMHTRNSTKGEDVEIRERVIKLVQSSGIFEKIEKSSCLSSTDEGVISFSVFYEFYKFQAFAFGEISTRLLRCMADYYEKSNPASAVGPCMDLLEAYRKEGRDELIGDVQKRIENNLQALRGKAINDEKSGNHRYAFNTYDSLLEYDFDCYEYHLGFLVNAIKSGKPEEAYNKILEDKVHRDYVLKDELLSGYYYDLAYIVAADEERPDFLQ